MLVNVRQLPGARVPVEYRVEISEGPGRRPTVPPVVRGEPALRDFLTKRLGLANANANRLIAMIDAQPHSAHVIEDVRINPNDLAVIVKELDRQEVERLNALP